MVKTALALLFVLLVSSFAVADDAILLPKGVFRARVIPSYSMTDKSFDKDGKKVATSAEGSVTAISGAFELGLADPLTLGFKWAPGYYAASDFSNAPAGFDKLVFKGPADLEIGAKLQVLGSKGLVKNDMARLAITAGGIVPLDSYDANDEWTNFQKGDAFRAYSTSSHQSVGFGFKADGDYKINDMFFLNLHGEAKYYLAKESLSFTTIATHYGTIAALAPSAGLATAVAYADANVPLTKTKADPVIETTYEFEPHAAIPLGGSTTLNVGVPVTYAMNLATQSTYNSVKTDIKATNILTVGPNVSLFTLIGPLPVEVQAQYSLPLMGELENATSTLSLQLKIFGKLY